jgi:DNA-3-methyladenine glycosylase
MRGCDDKKRDRMQKLPREFYARDTIKVAKPLPARHLVHHFERVGEIVEAEAYPGEHDLATHS